MATRMPHEFITKAGWVHRQSDILKRWKKQWCVLYGDGGLACYTDETRREREMVIRMPIDAIFINSGLAVRSVTPPDRRGHDSLIEIRTHLTSINLCAESPDDCKAWTIALEQMRSIQPPPRVYSAPGNVTVIHRRQNPPQTYRASTVTTTTFPDGHTVVTPGPTQTMVYPTTQHTQVIQTAPGQAVYIDPNQYGEPGHVIIDRTRNNGTSDFATGAVVGAAAGAMLMGPLLWGPMLW
ncbi:pleckstrin homology domain-containing family B member 2-like isoform X2 [Saccoglossus kowalevskii]|uniref:Pleckstrin homology domain-containing family B member 2-like isoform X1 n=1 Tax=Saccoglossus kowalevskii TaxID=10224 RepID=A0ABM0GWL7_SACKO|nr:PREDICTED: pleckstrin homology domain-containing family B member 2-like isoform X1 [Saccoglossus kowalevskii]